MRGTGFWKILVSCERDHEAGRIACRRRTHHGRNDGLSDDRTPRPISTTYQHSLSTTQPSLGTRTARAATERPNQQICRVADHQARPVPELPWGEPGLDCGRFLRLDMPQNRHEEPFPAHMAMK